jgi:DNA-binding CsgD family transcriptional regulator
MRLYGQESVLTPLYRMLDSAKTGNGGVAVVEGAAGSGKTLLLEVMGTAARQRGLPTSRIDAHGRLRGPTGPCVILADDAHQLSSHVLRDLHGALPCEPVVLLTLRPSRPRRDVDRILRTDSGPPVWLVLKPLGRDAVTQICLDLYGAPPTARLFDWIWTAGGNPSLTRALVEGLHSEDRIRVEGDLARLEPADDTLPALVMDLVQALLFELSASCRQLVSTAAALGPVLDPALLATMLGQSTAALLPAWEEALGGGVLVRQGGELAFGQELLRQAVAESLPPAIRDALRDQRDRLTGHPAELGTTEPGAGKLTARERNVLLLVSHGRSNQQIARELGISDHAVKRHVSSLLIKFNCSNRTELALLALRQRP